MNEKLTDLRFVIGLFFLATGLILTGHYLLQGKSDSAYPGINLYCGLGFLAFGAFMVLLSVTGKKQEQE